MTATPSTPTSSAPDAVPEAVRRRLALVLDVDRLDDALALAAELQPWFGVAKVGLELYTAAGPTAVSALVDAGFDVFADLKLHDIPNTVGHAATVLGRLGARYATLHAPGGEAMLRAGVDGLRAGAAAAGHPEPMALAVTVLTSLPRDDDAVVARAGLAAAAGCGGVVCAAVDLPTVRRVAPGLRPVVPGIRLAGSSADDQARPATPASAIAGGAHLLVVGRTVTAAPDRRAAAAAVAAEVAEGLVHAAPTP